MNEVLFDKNICIVVQGPITYIDNIIKTYLPIKENVIISTNDKNVTDLINYGFNVKINDLASISGRANFNNQVKNTFEGIKIANELGFSHVLKIRSDIFIDDISKFISFLKLDRIYFPAYHNHDGGYLCEHMIFGPIKLMIKLWDIPISTSNLPPETQLTNKYNEINDDTKIDFLFPILYNKNIKAYWQKYKIFLNQYENDNLFIYEKK